MFFGVVGGDHGSSTKTRSTSRVSRDVRPSTENRGRTTVIVHASALLVLRNLDNVARVVCGWLLPSCKSSSIFGGRDLSQLGFDTAVVVGSPSINTASLCFRKTHLSLTLLLFFILTLRVHCSSSSLPLHHSLSILFSFTS